MKKSKVIISIIIIVLFIVMVVGVYDSKNEIRSIRSEKELSRVIDNNVYGDIPFIYQILGLPFSIFVGSNNTMDYQWNDIATDGDVREYTNDVKGEADTTGNKDYSKTNIQVEGVDEADIIKTDGDYIYSLSESKVVITNVKDPNNIKVESTIDKGTAVPEDLLLYKDKLIVISSKSTTSNSWYYSNNNTVVTIYDIKDKSKPDLVKSFELYESYETTRCIDGNLYIFSEGYLREKNDKVDRRYKEDSRTKELDLKDIKYIKNEKNNTQTLIAQIDLNNIDKGLNLSSYLFDITDAYISKDNIYLLKEGYYGENVSLKNLFGLKGIFGLFNDYNYYSNTKVYKFNIDKKVGVKYVNNTSVEGIIDNQYSLDEKDNNLRIAVETNDGTQVVVLDKNLKKLGESEKVAEGERMYASRFMGDKAYVVTYRNTDPLFVIDLSDPKNPEVLGELEIPGYSTYLHPYDENHLIGIGMNTEEVVNRDINGKVTSTWVETTGMKMALFDVSDVSSPKEIDSVKIGDSRTVSAILNNPKALLFSKEKNLLAIPVNNYDKDFSIINNEDDTYYFEDEMVDYYDYGKNYIAEGYLVYNVDLKGFKQRGTITHEKERRYGYYNTKLLRGLYIEDNLFTISEDYIKVNKLEDLSEINSLKLKGEK